MTGNNPNEDRQFAKFVVAFFVIFALVSIGWGYASEALGQHSTVSSRAADYKNGQLRNDEIGHTRPGWAREHIPDSWRHLQRGTDVQREGGRVHLAFVADHGKRSNGTLVRLSKRHDMAFAATATYCAFDAYWDRMFGE